MLNSGSITKLYQTGTTIMNSFLAENKKNQILEPLSCLIRLAMLGFKDKGVKISINQNKISFHEPSFYQGPLRWHYGDTRNDLHNLHNPLIKCTEWYDTNIIEIKNIIRFTLKGLTRLKESYEKQSIIQHTLDHYINILGESIKNSHKEKRIKKSDMDLSASLFKENSIIEEPINNGEELVNSGNMKKENVGDEHSKNMLKPESSANYNLIYKKLKEIWTYREIKIINNILLEMNNKNSKNEEDFRAYLLSIDNILCAKDKAVFNIIQTMTTIL